MMPGSIVVRDATSLIYYANRAFAQTYGLAVRDVIGLRDSALWAERGRPPEQVARWLAEDRAVLESGNPMEYVQEIVRQNGECAYFLNYKIPLIMRDGRRYIFVQYAEISERHRMELRLARGETLAAEVAGIHKATVTYAHEINNPLTGILALAELMLDHDDCPASFQEMLLDLKSAAQRIAATIRQLESMEIPLTKRYLGRPELLDLQERSAGDAEEAPGTP